MIKRSWRYSRFNTLVLLLILGMGESWAAAGGPWSYGVETTVLYDDNISRAQHSPDIESDYVFSASADASYTWGFSELMALTAQGALQDEEYFDFEKLSNTRFGLTGDFRFQTRIGFTAPSYSVFLRVTEADFETDIRDATTTELGFRVTRRLTDIITGTAGFTWSDSSAEGRVFDLERIRYFGNIDYRITNRWSAYATLNYIDGDVFSTATGDDLEILNIVTNNARNILTPPAEPDNAFGGAANNKIAYRLDAKTTILRLGGNYGIDAKNAIDFSIDILESEAQGSVEYDRLSTAVSFLHRF
jgi:hypothetical protein